MIVGIGTDIIEIARVRGACLKWSKFPVRVFTAKEWDYCRKGKRYEALAARFAGKEAVAKALGTGIGEVNWREVEILNDLAGVPQVELLGQARVVAAQKGIRQIMLTLSHSRDYAIAYAVALGGYN